MKFSLQNKTAVITGGGSGIGKAISKVFAQQGANVHILELNEDNSKETVDEITKENGIAQGHICNISDKQSVQNAINTILENTPIDILVNNAGIAHIGNVENTSTEDLDKLYNVNIKGVYNCIQAVISSMKGTGGVILNNVLHCSYYCCS